MNPLLIRFSAKEPPFLISSPPMKATKTLLAGLLLAGLGGSSFAAELRTWTDVEGRQVSASFVQIDGDLIVLQTQDGVQHRFPLTRLSAEDQTAAKTAQAAVPAAPAQPQMLANATVAQAAARVDKLVANGLIKANPARKEAGKAPISSFNPMANDEQFVRRVYLDISGRIPNYDEASAFIKDTAPDKRAKLIDRLLESDGYKADRKSVV